jgi:hypothetical protein
VGWALALTLAPAILPEATRPAAAQTKAPDDTHPARRNLREYNLELIERPWLPDWASRLLDSPAHVRSNFQMAMSF